LENISEHPIIVNDIPVSITTNGDGVNLIFSSLTCDTELRYEYC